MPTRWRQLGLVPLLTYSEYANKLAVKYEIFSVTVVHILVQFVLHGVVKIQDKWSKDDVQRNVYPRIESTRP